jgi:hypothetical protein
VFAGFTTIAVGDAASGYGEFATAVSLSGEYRVADPGLFVTQSSDPFGAVFLELRQALLTAVGETQSDALLEGQPGLIARVRELALPRTAQLGVELTQLSVWEAAPIGWVQEVE